MSGEESSIQFDLRGVAEHLACYCGALCRSYWRHYGVQINRPSWRSLGVIRGRAFCSGSPNATYTFPFYSSGQVYANVRYAVLEPTHDLLIISWGGEWNGYWFVSTPLWLPASLFAVIALIARRYALKELRGSAGHCPICGYDLRATPERCPECGTVTVHSSTSAPPS